MTCRNNTGFSFCWVPWASVLACPCLPASDAVPRASEYACPWHPITRTTACDGPHCCHRRFRNSIMCWSYTFCACGPFRGKCSSSITLYPMPIHSRKQSSRFSDESPGPARCGKGAWTCGWRLCYSAWQSTSPSPTARSVTAGRIAARGAEFLEHPGHLVARHHFPPLVRLHDGLGLARRQLRRLRFRFSRAVPRSW